MKHHSNIWMVILSLLLAATTVAMKPMAQVHQVTEPVVKPSDSIHLKIVGVLDKTLEVSDDGMVDFGLWGQVYLGDLTQPEAEIKVKQFLKKYIKIDNVNTFLTLKKRPAPQAMVRVSVFGEVRNPGVYPLERGWNALDYVIKAGGTTRFALTDRVKLICVQQDRLLEFSLELAYEGGIHKAPEVEPGCVIFVPEKTPDESSWLRNASDQVVHLLGMVVRPGRYEFKPGFSLTDVLSHAGGVTPDADATKLSILSGKKVQTFNLDAYFRKNGALPKIRPGDIIYVPERSKIFDSSWTKKPASRSIYIIGQIQKAGRYDFTKTLNFFDLVSHAGGPTRLADLRKITIMRNNQVIAHFDMRGYLMGKGGIPPKLQPEDTVYLPAIKHDLWVEKHPNSVVNVLGQVGIPGRYEVEKENLSIIDILTAAGGIRQEADLEKIRIIRRPSELQKKSLALSKNKLSTHPDSDYKHLSNLPPKRVHKKKPSNIIPGIGYEPPNEEASYAEEEERAFNYAQEQPKKLLVTVFNLEQYQLTGDPRLLPEIQLGDTVFVATKGLRFWEELKTIGGIATVLGTLIELGVTMITLDASVENRSQTP